LGERNGKIVKNKVLNAFKTNVNEKYIIYTKLGRRIICSKNHKFLTKNRGYVEPKDLNRGDILMSV
jgi:intein/homing endonuclease